MSVCEGVKRNRAGDEAGLGGSGYIMHSLMGYSQGVLFYCVVSGENSGEIGWQTLPLVFSRIAKALEGLERCGLPEMISSTRLSIWSQEDGGEASGGCH